MDMIRSSGATIKMDMIRSLGSNNMNNANGIQLANQGGIVGGLRLPRTGRVMAPKSSPGQGGTYNQDGGTVQKFLELQFLDLIEELDIPLQTLEDIID